MLTAKQLKEMWFKFFIDRGHKRIASSSVVPENDPSVLFTTAGMHPLVPYLLGEKHPMGKRLCDVQKCIRTGDIDEVGDESHLTFFEMLGNWSLGDYFKEEMIKWSFEFLTSPQFLGINKEKIAVTVFAGDEYVSKDVETETLWKSLGVRDGKIFLLKDNWWILGSGTGPCGPCTEMFVDTGKPSCGENCNPSCSCGKYLEIWNDVFMQYRKITADASPVVLSQKNVDTGMGLERVLCIVNNVNSVYDTELFLGAIKKIEGLSGLKYKEANDEKIKSFRIIADHIRAATAILGDDVVVTPSNTDAGYVLRRLIRRSILNLRKLGIGIGHLGEIADEYIEYFKDFYPEFFRNRRRIIDELNTEEQKFEKTLQLGQKEFQKVLDGLKRKNEYMKSLNKNYKEDNFISGKTAFRLYETYGFPLDITKQLAQENNLIVDEVGFLEAYKKHQDLARQNSEQHFKGGLADTSEKTIRLHTACHLLNAALRKVLGEHVYQRGSNITSERLRFDFSHDKPLTIEQIKEVETLVNNQISKNIKVVCEEKSLEDAKKDGAIGVFDNKYGQIVKVYSIGDFSREICGGPHVGYTGELGKFKIVKEQSSSAGIRRIRAELE